MQRKILLHRTYLPFVRNISAQVTIIRIPDGHSPVPVCEHHHDVQRGQEINKMKEGITISYTFLFITYHLLASFLLVICEIKTRTREHFGAKRETTVVSSGYHRKDVNTVLILLT